MSVLPALTELGTLTHASGARPMPDGPVFWDNKAMDGPESGAGHGAVACEFQVSNDHFFSVSIFMQCLYFRSLTVRPSAKACFSNSDSRPRRDGDVPPRTQNTRCGNGDIASQTITKKQTKAKSNGS